MANEQRAKTSRDDLENLIRIGPFITGNQGNWVVSRLTSGSERAS